MCPITWSYTQQYILTRTPRLPSTYSERSLTMIHSTSKYPPPATRTSEVLVLLAVGLGVQEGPWQRGRWGRWPGGGDAAGNAGDAGQIGQAGEKAGASKAKSNQKKGNNGKNGQNGKKKKKTNARDTTVGLYASLWAAPKTLKAKDDDHDSPTSQEASVVLWNTISKEQRGNVGRPEEGKGGKRGGNTATAKSSQANRGANRGPTSGAMSGAMSGSIRRGVSGKLGGGTSVKLFKTMPAPSTQQGRQQQGSQQYVFFLHLSSSLLSSPPPLLLFSTPLQTYRRHHGEDSNVLCLLDQHILGNGKGHHAPWAMKYVTSLEEHGQDQLADGPYNTITSTGQRRTARVPPGMLFNRLFGGL